MKARYVILGLGHPRSDWFRRIAQWCNGGAIPAELVKCLSAEDIEHRLDTGRSISAVLIEAGIPGVDRDLFSAARVAGCAVIVIDDARVSRDWLALGAAAILSPGFDRHHLVDALASHAQLIERVSDSPVPDVEPSTNPLRGQLVAVIGAGGTGVSTVAIATAQALALTGGRVLLADLKLNAEQAMLHDVTRPTGGLMALVDAHRTARLGREQLDEICLRVPSRGYDLLTGLHRARFWSSVRPVAFTAALATLTNNYDRVVCDLDSDLEREETGGSLEVEERTSMTRLALHESAVVLLVGHPSMKGLHSMHRVLIELGDLGVPTAKVVPVFNQAGRSPRMRAGYTAALAELIEWRNGSHPSVSPVYLPAREVDDALRTGSPLPEALTAPLLPAVTAVVGSQTAPGPSPRFQRIKPGSIRSVSREAS